MSNKEYIEYAEVRMKRLLEERKYLNEYQIKLNMQEYNFYEKALKENKELEKITDEISNLKDTMYHRMEEGGGC